MVCRKPYRIGTFHDKLMHLVRKLHHPVLLGTVKPLIYIGYEHAKTDTQKNKTEHQRKHKYDKLAVFFEKSLQALSPCRD
jgi:hypothetical protein